MEFLVISGMSGGGKSRVADILEDLHYYCVDNMPVEMIPRFAEFCLATRGRYEKVALVTDVRGSESFDELFVALDEMKTLGCECKILYIEATIPTIVRRYKETRRKHPLDPNGHSLESAVKKELELLKPVRDRADFIINSTDLTLGQLQRKLFFMFQNDRDRDKPIRVNVISFGFKYGIPMESDLVFDVRYLPNPYYEESLRNKSGLDEPVSEYVFSKEEAVEFLKKLEDMIEYLLPLYIVEGKYTLTVSIGCTGGRHRSVAIAKALTDFIAEKGYSVELSNRDLDKS